MKFIALTLYFAFLAPCWWQRLARKGNAEARLLLDKTRGDITVESFISKILSQCREVMDRHKTFSRIEYSKPGKYRSLEMEMVEIKVSPVVLNFHKTFMTETDGAIRVFTKILQNLQFESFSHIPCLYLNLSPAKSFYWNRIEIFCFSSLLSWMCLCRPWPCPNFRNGYRTRRAAF